LTPDFVTVGSSKTEEMIFEHKYTKGTKGRKNASRQGVVRSVREARIEGFILNFFVTFVNFCSNVFVFHRWQSWPTSKLRKCLKKWNLANLANFCLRMTMVDLIDVSIRREDSAARCDTRFDRRFFTTNIVH